MPSLNRNSTSLPSPSCIKSENSSIFSLACPVHAPPRFAEPPIWTVGPYPQYHSLLTNIPGDHIVAATTHGLIDWLKGEGVENGIVELALDADKLTIDRQTLLDQQLQTIDELSSPVWLLLDYSLDDLWNEQILSHALDSYYVAQPKASAAEWLECKQRFVLALPTSVDELQPVHESIDFGGKLIVEKWRVGGRSYHPGDIVPIELEWGPLDDGDLKFYVHLLDLDWNLYAQIDLSADLDATADSQITRMGLYLPPDLPAGEYQVRLGVYRADDGQRLTLPNGEDSIHIPFTVTQ